MNKLLLGDVKGLLPNKLHVIPHLINGSGDVLDRRELSRQARNNLLDDLASRDLNEFVEAVICDCVYADFRYGSIEIFDECPDCKGTGAVIKIKATNGLVKP